MLHRESKTKEDLLECIKNNPFISSSVIIQKYPDLDRTTIYRNIKKLESEGLIRKVYIKSKAYYVPFEQKPEDTLFVCNKCGRITSLSIDKRYISELPPIGSKLERFEINLYGVCNSCNF